MRISMHRKLLFFTQLTVLTLFFLVISPDIKKDGWVFILFLGISALLLLYHSFSLKKRLQKIGERRENLYTQKDQDFQPLINTLEKFDAKVQSQTQNFLEERDEKEVILESLIEGVITFNGEEKVSFINPMACKLLGLSKRKILGKTFDSIEKFVNNACIKKCMTLLKAAQEKESLVTDSFCLEKEKKIYLDLIAAPKAGKKGVILILQDKSNHQKILQMGKDFIANASHELRTPITVIKGFAETLQDLPQISPQMLRQIIEKITRNCLRMETLVKNLLTLADIENLPQTKWEECDVEAFMENCKEMLLTVRPDVQIQVECPQEKLTVAADPDLLELAIMNLLENAAKYSPSPVQIKMSAKNNEKEIELAIEDKGIGIPQEDQEHIFERFYTVDKAHSRSLGGAGLGLSIVKTIIEKHDGTISLVSQVKGSSPLDPKESGTVFTIKLPRAFK